MDAAFLSFVRILYTYEGKGEKYEAMKEKIAQPYWGQRRTIPGRKRRYDIHLVFEKSGKTKRTI